MSAEYKLRILQQEIQSIPGAKTITQERAIVCCPFHNDSNPSMTINLDVHERRAPIGWSHCFGCGKSVKWDEVAQTLRLKKFGKNEDLSSDDFADPSEQHESFLGAALGYNDSEEEDTWEAQLRRFPKMKELKFLKEWPFDEWRSVDVKLLKKVGARLVKHREYGTHYVWLPVNINGVLQGYVRAKLNKGEDGSPSYLNASGSWSRKWGLIYFDYAVELMKRKKLKTMVLCEGPRDSLRFLKQGVPAVSVLGALNWGSDKRSLLENADVEKAILAFDGDKAGWKATKLIYTDCKKFFDTKYLALWTKSSGWIPEKRRFKSDAELKAMKKAGTLTGEMDPFNMPQRYVDYIKEELE